MQACSFQHRCHCCILCKFSSGWPAPCTPLAQSVTLGTAVQLTAGPSRLVFFATDENAAWPMTHLQCIVATLSPMVADAVGAALIKWLRPLTQCSLQIFHGSRHFTKSAWELVYHAKSRSNMMLQTPRLAMSTYSGISASPASEWAS